jgi:hypothetical protein
MTEKDFNDKLKELSYGADFINRSISMFYKLQTSNHDMTFEKWFNHIIEIENKVPDTPEGFVSLD